MTLQEILKLNSVHKIIGFDIDGVLVDSLATARETFAIYASEYNLQDKITLDYARNYCMVGTPKDILKNFLKNFEQEVNNIGIIIKGKKYSATEVLKSEKLLIEESSGWDVAYDQVKTAPIASDFAIKLLALLKHENYKIVLITSGNKDEFAKNETIIKNRYKELIDSGEVVAMKELFDVSVNWNESKPFGKPHKRPMEIALEKLKAKGLIQANINEIPAGIIFIGDGASDMEFAKNIGGFGIYLESTTVFKGKEWYKPAINFKDIEQLYLNLKEIL